MGTRPAGVEAVTTQLSGVPPPVVEPDRHTDGSRRRGRQPPRRVILPALLLLLLLGVLAVAMWHLQTPGGRGPVVASGTLELDEVVLAAQASGRITDLSVDQGDEVADGQLVGQLVDPVLDVQVKQSVSDPAQHQVSAAQLSKLELRAPIRGIVQKRVAHRGEFVASGTPILTVADPSVLKLTLYVFEEDLGRVSVGQNVSIAADGYGGRTFAGVVRSIAARAEFTPRNIQTARDRQNLVFAVGVDVPNADGALRGGLPVDATFVDAS